MVSTSIQDRTTEFRTILSQAQKRNTVGQGGAQRQSLLSDAQKREANGHAPGDAKPSRSDFARSAAQIGRGITGTMGKLEKLAQRRHPSTEPLNQRADVHSCEAESHLRRSTCRDCRVDLYHQTRPCRLELADLQLGERHAIQTSHRLTAQVSRSGGPAQQERRAHAAKQSHRRGSQFQGCARSPDQEHSGVKIEDRELCLFCLCTLPTSIRGISIRIPPLPKLHPNSEANALLIHQ